MSARLELETLVIRITGESSQFTSSMHDATQAINQFSDEMVSSLLRMASGASIALSKLASDATSEFASFDKAMVESTSIMNNVSAQGIKEMSKAVLSLSAVSKQGPTELAKGLYYLASAGLDAEKSIGALPIVQQFATAGAFDMLTATNLLTTAQAALGYRSKDTAQNLNNLSRMSDVLIAAETMTSATTEQLATSLTRDAGAALRATNKGLEEGVAALVAYGDQGIKGAMAGNMLGRALRLLQSSAVQHSEEQQKMGLAVFDSEGKMRNLADIIQNLEIILKKMSPEARVAVLEFMGFHALQQKAITPLLGMSDAIRETQKALENTATGKTADVATKQMEAFANKMQVLQNEISVALITIGEEVSPIFGAIAQGITSMFTAFAGIDSQTRQVIIAIAASLAVLTAAFVALVVIVKIAVIVFAVLFSGGLALVGFGLIAAGAIAATVAMAGFVEESGGISNSLKRIQEWASSTAQWLAPVGDAFISLFKTIWTESKELVRLLGVGFSDLWVYVFGETDRTWDDIRASVIDNIRLIEFGLQNFSNVFILVFYNIEIEAGRAAKNMAHSFKVAIDAITTSLLIMGALVRLTPLGGGSPISSRTLGVAGLVSGAAGKGIGVLEDKVTEEIDSLKEGRDKIKNELKDSLARFNVEKEIEEFDKLRNDLIERPFGFDLSNIRPPIAAATKAKRENEWDDYGEGLGAAMVKGFERGVKRFDSVFRDSVEGAVRLEDYQDLLAGITRSSERAGRLGRSRRAEARLGDILGEAAVDPTLEELREANKHLKNIDEKAERLPKGEGPAGRVARFFNPADLGD